jgi:hypothetical protein
MAELAQLNARRQELGEYCQQKLWPQVEALELKHKVDPTALKSNLIRFGPIAAIGFIVMQMGNIQKQPGNLKSAVMIIGFTGMILGGAFILKELAKIAAKYSVRAQAKKQLADEFQKSIVTFLDPSFSITPYCSFPKDVYHSSNLFPTSYDRSSASERIEGSLGKTKFVAMNIATDKEHRTKDSSGKTRIRYESVYRGLLVQADFNKKISGRTSVRTDSGERFVGGLARTAQRLKATFSKTSLIELENPDFESVYQVHSTDAVEARYILTPIFMERILALRQKRGVGFQIAFQDSKVIVAIPASSELYNAPFDLMNISASAERMMAEIFEVLELIEDLDLNNRLSAAA